MKKLTVIAIILLLFCTFSGCSCSGNDIQDYLDEHSTGLAAEFESVFETTGMECTSEFTVEEKGFVVDVNVQDLDNVDDELKKTVQNLYDGMGGTFAGVLDQIQEEVPEVEYITININEKDGDNLASVKVFD